MDETQTSHTLHCLSGLRFTESSLLIYYYHSQSEATQTLYNFHASDKNETYKLLTLNFNVRLKNTQALHNLRT